MPLAEPHRVKVWAGVVLFFGIGAAIALAVAFHMIDRGSPTVGAVLFGSCAGALGASFLFYVVFNALNWMKARRRSAGA